LDNGKKRFSGLKPVKGLIDDYDLMACSLSNNLQDFNDAIYVVSGFKGHNLDELLMNVKAKKHIGVEPGGGLDIKTVDIPYQARKTKLELDETNIYRFGMGFNSAQVGDGNITNIVIKSRYALLDMKCNKLEIRLKQLFRKILQVVLDEVNEQQGKDFRPEQVYFKFDREIMTNASDNAQIELTDAQKAQVEVQTVLSLQNVIDNETIVQMICEILDIDYEEIKAKLPKDEYADNQQAIDTLNQVVPEEGGGAA
jgi:SPP1 family phage portal protein